MEPVVGMDANAFMPLINTIPNPLEEMEKQIAFRVGLQGQQAEIKQRQAQADALAEKATRQQQFQQMLSQSDGSPKAISSLMMQFPEFAEDLKKGWDVRDEATRTADLSHIGGVYSAAASGKWDLAKKSAHERYDADKASGQTDEDDDTFIAQVDAAANGDKDAQKFVLNHLGVQAAAAAGPEHFASVLGGLKGGYTLGPGDVRLDDNGNVIAHSPFIKGDDGSLYDYDSVLGGSGGGQADTPPGTIAPKAVAVASTLSAAGLPAPVVAGFMGNFHAEGGYEGAQGDGGSASGIAQWREARAANFERIIGKPATEATPEEQAKFVAWEMEHPGAAGMTVQQRDAILAAKTPAQAAALIDQYYERSSGRDRKVRMSAATAFARASDAAPASDTSGKPKPLLPGKPKDAPSGYRWSADGTTLEKIPGGPAEASADQYKIMTPQENQAAGLDPNVRYQKNLKTGQVTALGGQDKSQGQLKPVPPQARNLIVSRRDALRQVDTALAALQKNPGAIGYIKGNMPESVVQRVDPNGVSTRAAIGKVSGQIIHDVSGAAVTLSEAPRFRPYIPSLTDTPRAAMDKLRNLRALLEAEQADFAATYGPENGYRGVNLAPVGAGSAPASNGVLPRGARVIGTYHGKRVIEVNGKRMVEQ